MSESKTTRRGIVAGGLALLGGLGLGAAATSRATDGERERVRPVRSPCGRLGSASAIPTQRRASPDGATRLEGEAQLVDRHGKAAGMFSSVVLPSGRDGVELHTFQLEGGTLLGMGRVGGYAVVGGTGSVRRRQRRIRVRAPGRASRRGRLRPLRHRSEGIRGDGHMASSALSETRRNAAGMDQGRRHPEGSRGPDRGHLVELGSRAQLPGHDADGDADHFGVPHHEAARPSNAKAARTLSRTTRRSRSGGSTSTIPALQGVETNTMRVELRERSDSPRTATAASTRLGRIHRMREELTFVFEKITVTWLNGGIVGTLEQ